MSILTIQSCVAYGHVGNSAAVFPLQLMGFDAIAVHTVLFSSHAGHKGWRGHAVEDEHVEEILEGLHQTGQLDGCEAIITGYIGTVQTARVVLEHIQTLREELDEDLLYVCDPVFGDHGHVYVDHELVDMFGDELCKRATTLVPNAFEMETLSGTKLTGWDEVFTATQTMHEKGAKNVIITGIDLQEDARTLWVYVSSNHGEERWRVGMHKHPERFVGTGDVFTAVLTGTYLKTKNWGEAAYSAACTLAHVLDTTRASGQRELRLVQTQHIMFEEHEEVFLEVLS